MSARCFLHCLCSCREGASSLGAIGDPRPAVAPPPSYDAGACAYPGSPPAATATERSLQQLLAASRSNSPSDSETSGIGSECSTDNNLAELMVTTPGFGGRVHSGPEVALPGAVPRFRGRTLFVGLEFSSAGISTNSGTILANSGDTVGQLSRQSPPSWHGHTQRSHLRSHPRKAGFLQSNLSKPMRKHGWFLFQNSLSLTGSYHNNQQQQQQQQQLTSALQQQLQPNLLSQMDLLRAMGIQVSTVIVPPGARIFGMAFSFSSFPLKVSVFFT